MFDLTPISTTNLLTIVQILVVTFGFFFSWKGLKATYESLRTANESLKLATKNTETAMTNLSLAVKSLELGTSNAQAQLYNQMVIQGRDLQFKFSELFHGGTDAANLKARQDQFIGTLLGYYSSCFELKKVLTLPTNVEKLLAADLRELMREKLVRDKWDTLKHLHSREFIEYAESVRGVQ